jgi:lactoylglutathione lyase
MLQHAMTIIYVDNVVETVSFFENVLDAKCRFLDKEKGYADFEGQGTRVALVSTKMMEDEMGGAFKAGKPSGFELTFVTNDVDSAVDKALKAGATLVAPKSSKFWSKEVAYVKSPQGILIEFCLPMQEA